MPHESHMKKLLMNIRLAEQVHICTVLKNASLDLGTQTSNGLSSYKLSTETVLDTEAGDCNIFILTDVPA